ncbi:hypothetical protein [Phenylobacterium sp.]|jgi:hypothetical protein|uniref:hypothetical protein n=1 Tax=Phenylobacterium sp. TaxID=1871053 RepID=UPI002E334E71|nr:hypothetical protein [Phenylobacterium sp.]HEX4711109.1 hypothetical protein [Phenylobacterium sp.]
MTRDIEPVDQVRTESDDDLLSRAEASEYLKRFGIRMRPATLARAWSTGSNGPPCRHVRGKPFYPREVLRRWAESQITGLRRSSREPTGMSEPALREQPGSSRHDDGPT